ncbi:DUF1850 domain-containing protein [Bacillus tuaregi]|uniref:DUF1850 domain-containing protein n=1 Tax=Bacillus tuaregi TaxID=1816695 RepID=UPI001F375638|nr:DUF1850 domain-containing protein [Bacillus tuaregi]
MKNKIVYLLFLLPFFLIMILLLIFTPKTEALVFQYQNSGKTLAYLYILEGETFQMKYTHSIHLSDVVESYEVLSDGRIKQYELMYEDFAIGMPANASEGETFEQVDGKYYIKNMERIFPSFDLRVGKVRANHTLIFEDNEYPLSQIIEPGTWVRLKIETINLWQRWKGVNILEK